MKIRNVTRGTVLASEARAAKSYWSRLVGLLGRASLKPGEGLLIEPCSSVHTAFMRFAIDVVTVDQSGKVVKLVSDLKPFRMSGMVRGKHAVIELPSGTIIDTETAVGDQISFDAEEDGSE